MRQLRNIVLLGLIISSPAFATRPPVRTECLAHAADEIVLARLLSSDDAPIYADKFGPIYLGRFIRLGRFKGFDSTRDGDKFDLPWRKGPEQPMFKSNSVYLIYLRHGEIGPYVLYGSRGAIEVTKQSLPEIMMLRQALENERPSHCAD